MKLMRSDDRILDFDVVFDGIWSTGDHTSKKSGWLVVESDTLLILYHAFLSKYCHICENLKSKYKNNEQLFHEEMASHIDSDKCQHNFREYQQV